MDIRSYLHRLALDKENGLLAVVLKAGLFCLSLLYGFGVIILISLNRIFARKLACKSVGVGNITLGGTGKTACVEYIAQYLSAQGAKVAVISRGYKNADEPKMLQGRFPHLPVIVDSDRRRAALKARNHGVSLVILDDAFQQWGVIKDLEVVVIDAGLPFGNGRLIPRGILREPLFGLKRADIFILSKTNIFPQSQQIKEVLRRLNTRAEIIEAGHEVKGFYKLDNPKEVIPADLMRGKSAALFCGIGDPDSFFALAGSCGMRNKMQYSFADHHNYKPADIADIILEAKRQETDYIITTEKDASRLEGVELKKFHHQLMVMRIEMVLKEGKVFDDRLRRLLAA